MKFIVRFATVSLLVIGQYEIAATVNITCPPTGVVGVLTFNPEVGNAAGNGMTASFTSSVGGPPATLAAAAAACGEDHFNWYQIVTADNQLPPGLAVPYVDPPSGGYDPTFDNTWADDRPWYYDEYAPAVVPPGRVVSPGLQLGANTTASTLSFYDRPNGAPGLHLHFMTWLVSVNANGTLHEFHEGFSWDFDRPTTAASRTASNVQVLLNPPTNAQFAQITTSFAPEPSTMLLIVSAGAGLVVFRRRRGA